MAESRGGVMAESTLEPKSIRIESAVRKLRERVERFEVLVSRIKGEAIPPAETEKDKSSSLSSVLENLPAELGELSERIEKATEELKELLF